MVIKDFIINIFIIIMTIIPTFSYHFHNRKMERVSIALSSAISIVLCMTFPSTVLPGHIYDMRFIPLLIGILYGGYKTGVFLAGILLGYRYYLGDDGFYTTLFSYPWVIVLTIFFSYRFHQFNRFYKQTIVIGLTMLQTSLVIMIRLIRFEDYDRRILSFFLVYMFMNVLAAWLAHYLIEVILENKVMKVEVQHAEKMHVIGELAASIAHEIRNPMTVARGFMQLLSQREKDEQNRKYMNMAIQELDRAESIINDYLSLAKPQLEKTETIYVGQLLHQVTSVISSFALINGVVIRTYSQDHLCIRGNSHKLTQVLINITKNGIEAMPQGGTLQIIASKHEEFIRIDVIDTGVGMSKKELGRLGSPFYSTKEKGTGLGLMVSYQIIESMGGKIYVESEKGKGTCFSVMLPAVVLKNANHKKVV
ncbi:two-component sensor histidine kinase [Collibacillus ludicampi]|uniref:histidine kinase n=1 Tax=Collibacillus ludicampi TaxID=2771369 RepID=A0AAV4LGJ5_9BACL|nr:ATP-binding protein [Collibacillus ludicampi]GIM46970.1 two-component sensor histidine kinase [Collibacillus ludicampi]